MIWTTIVHWNIWCHGIQRTQKLVLFYNNNSGTQLCVTSTYIFSILIEKVTLHQHHMKNYQQEASYIQEIILHTTTHQFRYQNVPSEPDSDPSSSDSLSLDSSQSSALDILNNDDTRKKHQSKKRFNDPINKCARLTANLLKYAYNLTATKFKFDENPLQRRVYFLPFMSSL